MKCCSLQRKHDMHKYSDMNKQKCGVCGQILLLLTGSLLTFFGLGIFLYFESIYEFMLNEGLQFTNNSPAYMAWRTNDPPLIMDIYLFNWTNPDQLKNTSVKPKLEEIGPYRFKEVKDKINITWHSNKTVSYKSKHYYYFDAEKSIRNLSDVITIINIVPLSISYKMRFQSYFLKKSVSFALTTMSKLHVTKKAGDILFYGYEEPILKSLSYLPIPAIMDKFGLFYGKNGSIEKGISSMSYANDGKFGKLISFNHKNRTDYFEGKCGEIKGSAGEFYPLNIGQDKLTFYSPEFCRYAEMEFEQEVEIKGVKGYKFTGVNLFDNGTKLPENACFCANECIPSGALNVSSCRDNSPSFLSFAHFYGADPYYTDAIEGMRPNRSLHEFYIIIEPKSGIVMDIGVTMQLNMLLQPVKYIRMYEKVPKIFMPVFYFAQHVELSDDLATNLRLIQSVPEYGNYTVLILILLGLGSIAWALCSFFCCSRTKVEYTINEIKRPNGTISCHEEVPLNQKR